MEKESRIEYIKIHLHIRIYKSIFHKNIFNCHREKEWLGLNRLHFAFYLFHYFSSNIFINL